VAKSVYVTQNSLPNTTSLMTTERVTSNTNNVDLSSGITTL